MALQGNDGADGKDGGPGPPGPAVRFDLLMSSRRKVFYLFVANLCRVM